nr:leucine-rich repeat domain-containing protein [Acholeplasmatales bacterium]
YNKKVKKKKAKLYFSFSPTNNKALISDGLEEFENELKEKLDFNILGSVLDYTYNELYFYDTNFHLNYSGSLMHTKKLSENLANELNIEIKEEVNTISVPEPLYVNEGSITVDGLTYTKSSNSYYIEGYTSELGNPTELTIPSELFGLPVIGLDDECFKDLESLETIYINDPFTSFGANCFEGCSNLKAIYLNTSKAPAVPTASLVTGASDEIAIYIPKSLVRNYTSGYSWMAYLDYIKTY